MPHIDARTGEIVLRIVYDGAPEAGKTTNVVQLGKQVSLQRRGAAKSPGTEGERTAFFDWLDFSGGYLDGRRVRCQLVSVPGQSPLLHRRRYLLESADAIVYVADSRPPAFDEARRSLAATIRIVARCSGPVPVGVILQTNKQDLPDAVTPSEVARALEVDITTPIVSSAAAKGDGVMQTFILAVRLATDRVRELMLKERLDEKLDAIETPESLHAVMVAREQQVQQEVDLLPVDDAPLVDPVVSEIAVVEPIVAPAVEAGPEPAVVVAKAVSEVPSPVATLPPPAMEPMTVALESSTAAQPVETPPVETQAVEEPVPVQVDPRRPRANAISSPREVTVPVALDLLSGHVWQPVRGRSTIAIATTGELIAPKYVQPWAPVDAIELFNASGWWLHSSTRWFFESEAVARPRLLTLVRALAANSELVPDARSAALARDADGWRLWLVTPRMPTLADAVRELVDTGADRSTLHSYLDRAVAAIARAREFDLPRQVRGGCDGLAMQSGRVVSLGIDEPAWIPELPTIDPEHDLRQRLEHIG